MVQRQGTLTEVFYYFAQVLRTKSRTVSQTSLRSFYRTFFPIHSSSPYKLRYLQRAKQITEAFLTPNAPTSNPDIMLEGHKTMAWNEECFWWCQWRWLIDLLASGNVRMFHSTDIGRGHRLNESQCSKWKPSNAFHSHITAGNRVYLPHHVFKYQLWNNANFSYYAAKVGRSINSVTLWCTKGFLSNHTVNRQVRVW